MSFIMACGALTLPLSCAAKTPRNPTQNIPRQLQRSLDRVRAIDVLKHCGGNGPNAFEVHLSVAMKSRHDRLCLDQASPEHSRLLLAKASPVQIRRR